MLIHILAANCSHLQGATSVAEPSAGSYKCCRCVQDVIQAVKYKC